ncbi:MAG: acetate--CoA ligase family protein [Proteobacteria bacterium]|nr:acetate--CoA ligase family protein [Pseudomonadota bacterium]
MMKLERLLRPKSIAAIGGLQASRVVEQCQLMGYEGEIWPVHPSKTEVRGLPAYASVEELPGAPDAAFIGVNRHLTIEVVRSLRAIGAGGAVCYASGFLESDETGGQLQSELIEAAGDMPIIGPNCYGLINYADGALLWPDQQGGRRLPEGHTGVAIITQSSNIAINFTMQRRGLPLAYMLTVGNQAQVGMSDLALNMLDDPRVSALGLYIEGFDSIAAMETLAQRARTLGKPVVVFKVGESEQAQVATLSHTASLAGSQAAASAFLKRNGFGQANSIPVFLESLKLLHVHGPLNGYRISSMSCSGGEASIMADTAVGKKVYFPALDEAQKKPVQDALGPLVTVSNPLDYHNYCWGNSDVMTRAYTAMVGNGFDMNFLVLDFPHSERCDDSEWLVAVDAFEAALKANKAKGALAISMSENIPESYTEAFMERGIVSLYGFEEALKAAEIAADIGQAWQHEHSDPVLEPTATHPEKITLDEASAKQRLASFEVPIPSSHLVTSVQQAVENADKTGYPLVLKALGIVHKTEANAMRLNLQSADAVAKAANALLELSDRLYLESMVEDVVAELIVGITHDAQFGLVMTIGSGGILVEIMKDSRTLVIPATRSQIENLLAELKSAPLFAGYRGKPKADIKAAVDAILAIQHYAIDASDRLLELDVNPLLLCAEGKGVFAADALIVLQEK